MSQKKGSHSLQGNWRGWYMHNSHDGKYGFEAVFIEKDGSVDGNILDDGQLGEANVSGSFGYPNLSFTKRYYSRRLNPVKYTGVMSEDGNTISGSWYIVAGSKGGSGTWQAVRFEPGDLLTLQDEEARNLDEQKERAEPELVRIRER